MVQIILYFSELEFGDLDGIDRCFVDLAARPEDAEKVQYLTYDQQFVPPDAKHMMGLLHLSLSITRKQRNISTEVNPNRSLAEFEAEFRKYRDGLFDFYLYNDQGTRIGLGEIDVVQLPDWLTADNGNAYVTVELEYDYERTLEQSGFSEAEIEQDRERVQAEITEWEANHS